MKLPTPEEENMDVMCINCDAVVPCEEAEAPIDVRLTDDDDVVHTLRRHYTCSQECIIEFTKGAI